MKLLLLNPSVGFLLLCLWLGAAVAAPARAPRPGMVARAPLRDLAEKLGIKVGVTDGAIASLPYINSVPESFSSITLEGALKFENVHPCPPRWLVEGNSSLRGWVEQHGQSHSNPSLRCALATLEQDEWHWETVDVRVAWAAANNLAVYGHTLLWHSKNPAWLSHPGVSLSLAERSQLLAEHIQGVIGHNCSANIYAYDVINEGLGPDGDLLELGPWHDIPDYIDGAFRIARAALDQCNRQEVKLFYNDFEIEYGRSRWYSSYVPSPGYYNKHAGVHAYLKRLLERAEPTPIDGIGFQTHLFLAEGSMPHDTGAMIQAMRAFVQLGLEVKITEMDVTILDQQPARLYQAQASQFSGAVYACLAVIRCTGFTTWGVHDGWTWRNGAYPNSDPLMFYDAKELLRPAAQQLCQAPGEDTQQSRYCPKPAFEAVYATFLRATGGGAHALARLYLPLARAG